MADRNKRRWVPAFSIRTSLILMTLFCAYAACWWPTKTRGIEDVDDRTWGRGVDAERLIVDSSGKLPSTFSFRQPSEAIAPLLVTVETRRFAVGGDTTSRRYYFWFFGYTAELPLEHEIQPETSEIIEYGGRTLPSPSYR